jgi:hypothetical protein
MIQVPDYGRPAQAGYSPLIPIDVRAKLDYY